MPSKNTTKFYKNLIAAQRTVDLIDHENTPDRISDAVLETLIEMSAGSRISIWDKATGINLEQLAALYMVYQLGNGFRRSRLYGRYEAERLERAREQHNLDEGLL
jgi:hypothetical protein